MPQTFDRVASAEAQRDAAAKTVAWLAEQFGDAVVNDDEGQYVYGAFRRHATAEHLALTRKVQVLKGEPITLFEKWGMYSDEGNAAVTEAMQGVEKLMRDGTVATVGPQASMAIETVQAKVAAAGHGEVGDTAVRERLWDAVDIISATYNLSRL